MPLNSNVVANHHLRRSLVFFNVPTMQQPEAYIGNFGNLFDQCGNLLSDSFRKFATKFIQAFDTWVETNNCYKAQ